MFGLKVTLGWVVSMAALIWITLASTVAAHEVLPTIGDMEVVDGQITFSLNGNFESLVAGIDLDGLEDTEAAPEVDVYDALRALEPDVFAQRFNDESAQILSKITVLVDGNPVELTLTGIEVPAVGNVAVVRQSVVTFAGEIPDGAQSMQIEWPADTGGRCDDGCAGVRSFHSCGGRTHCATRA